VFGLVRTIPSAVRRFLGRVNAVRFLYGITLGRNTEGLTTSVPHMKHAIRRSEIYARSELEAILSAPSAEPAARPGGLDDGLCLRATQSRKQGI
jgi:hypothetical protein